MSGINVCGQYDICFVRKKSIVKTINNEGQVKTYPVLTKVNLRIEKELNQLLKRRITDPNVSRAVPFC